MAKVTLTSKTSAMKSKSTFSIILLAILLQAALQHTNPARLLMMFITLLHVHRMNMCVQKDKTTAGIVTRTMKPIVMTAICV